MMPPKETPEMRLPETPLLKKSQQELTGGLCKVTTESELMLNDHHQGSQHKSKLETTLKASLLEAKDTGPSSLVTCESQCTNIIDFSCVRKYSF